MMTRDSDDKVPISLRILHVWDQAGVSCLMALEQRKRGHHADIIVSNTYDAGMCQFYGITEHVIPFPDTKSAKSTYRKIPQILKTVIRTLYRKYLSLRFYLKVAKLARYYDIIHIHSMWLTWFFLPFKKKVLEFHGDDIRKHPSKTRFKKLVARAFIWLYSKFRTVYVSTPDLLNNVPNSRLIPNPVDTIHFTLQEPVNERTALCSLNWYDLPNKHVYHTLAKAFGLSLTILNRAENEWIPYEQFPKYLAPFGFYIDRFNIPSLSKTGLEALAMGKKVVDFRGRIHDGLPVCHHPKNVANQTLQIYNQL